MRLDKSIFVDNTGDSESGAKMKKRFHSVIPSQIIVSLNHKDSDFMIKIKTYNRIEQVEDLAGEGYKIATV